MRISEPSAKSEAVDLSIKINTDDNLMSLPLMHQPLMPSRRLEKEDTTPIFDGLNVIHPNCYRDHAWGCLFTPGEVNVTIRVENLRCLLMQSYFFH